MLGTEICRQRARHGDQLDFCRRRCVESSRRFGDVDQRRRGRNGSRVAGPVVPLGAALGAAAGRRLSRRLCRRWSGCSGGPAVVGAILIAGGVDTVWRRQAGWQTQAIFGAQPPNGGSGRLRPLGRPTLAERRQLDLDLARVDGRVLATCSASPCPGRRSPARP